MRERRTEGDIDDVRMKRQQWNEGVAEWQKGR